MSASAPEAYNWNSRPCLQRLSGVVVYMASNFPVVDAMDAKDRGYQFGTTLTSEMVWEDSTVLRPFERKLKLRPRYDAWLHFGGASEDCCSVVG